MLLNLHMYSKLKDSGKYGIAYQSLFNFYYSYS